MPSTHFRTIEREGRTLKEFKVTHGELTETFQVEEGKEQEIESRLKQVEKRLRVKEFEQNLNEDNFEEHELVNSWPCSRCQKLEELTNSLCSTCYDERNAKAKDVSDLPEGN